MFIPFLEAGEPKNLDFPEIVSGHGGILVHVDRVDIVHSAEFRPDAVHVVAENRRPRRPSGPYYETCMLGNRSAYLIGSRSAFLVTRSPVGQR